jgi:dCMP deaminase
LRSVGAVLVKNRRVLSVGYNGCPKGVPNCFEDGCIRCNGNTKQGEDLNKCYCLHAEEAAIMEAGLSKTEGAYIYTTLHPCLWCAKLIVHAVLHSHSGHH